MKICIDLCYYNIMKNGNSINHCKMRGKTLDTGKIIEMKIIK